MRDVRYHSPLPEALPDADCWTGLLWPWCDRIDETRPHCAVVARSLAYAMDGRDNTVDVEQVRVGSRADHRKVVGELIDHGYLEPANPGRCRVVLPEQAPRSRPRVRR